MFVNPELLAIPAERRCDLNSDPPDWNTEVRVKGFVAKDPRRAPINIDQLDREIRERFRDALQKRSIEVTIFFTDGKGKRHEPRRIKPLEFTGRPFKQWSRRGEDCKSARFNFYRLTEPTGTVLFQTAGTPDNLSMARAAAQFKELGLKDDVIRVLLSGYVEGIAQIDGCRLEENRSRFVIDNAIYEFMDFLENFVEAEIAPYVEQLREKSREEVEQAALRDALEAIQPVTAAIYDLLDEVLDGVTGGVSHGHRSVEGGKKGPLATTGEKPTGHPASPRTRTPGGDTAGKPQRERRKCHIGIIPARGGYARIAAASQPGFYFGYDEMQGSARRFRWEMTDKGLMLLINQRHKDFLACWRHEQSQAKMAAYNVEMLKYALTLMPVPQEVQERIRSHHEDHHMRLVMAEILAEPLKGR